MEKTVYIGEKNGRYYLEIVGKDRDGVSYRKRTNDPKKIHSFIDEEGKQFLDGKIKEDDLILYTTNKIRLVLRKYQNLQQQAPFRKIFRRLKNTPFLPKNIASGRHSNIIQILGLKLHYVNKTKLAALALSGIVFTTGVSFTVPQNSKYNAEPESQAIEQLLEEVAQNDEEQLLEIMDIDYRLQQTMKMKEQYQEYDNSKIMLGLKIDENRIREILESDRGKIIFSISKTYGIDPYLLLAKGLAESNLEHEACCPGGLYYNGYGVGAWQLESPSGEIVSAWNYDTGKEESLAITIENAIDFQKNGQAAAMNLQNRLNLYHGNIYLALQSYNYGSAMMNVVIHDYAQKMGVTEEEIKNNINDLGWLEIVHDVHENPNNYYYRAVIGSKEKDPVVIAQAKKDYVWKNGTYGNDHYIADVLAHYVGVKSQNKNLNGTSSIIDFYSNEVIELAAEQTNKVSSISMPSIF